MRGRLIRLALLVLAFILLLSTLGSSVGVVELGVLGLLLAASGLVIMRPRRRDRGCSDLTRRDSDEARCRAVVSPPQ